MEEGRIIGLILSIVIGLVILTACGTIALVSILLGLTFDCSTRPRSKAACWRWLHVQRGAIE